MSDTCVWGKNLGVLCDGFDMQRLLNSAQDRNERGDFDTTTFGQGDKTGKSSLRGGVLSCEGFYYGQASAYQALLAEAIGTTDQEHKLAYCPEGYAIGKQGVVFLSNQNSFEVGAAFDGAVMTNVVWGATGGMRLGTVLHSHAGSTAIGGNESQTWTFSAVSESQRIGVRAATGTSIQDVDFTSSAAANLEAAIEALGEYESCSVTGTLTASGSTPNRTFSGTLTIAFNGLDANENVPATVPVQGETRLFHPASPAGNYTINGSATFAAGDSVASIQAKLRATTGAGWPGVLVSGTSTSSTATLFGTDGNSGDATNVSNAFDGDLGTAVTNMRFANAVIGVIYTSDQTVSTARIHEDVDPNITWTFQSSDDTTDGEDGTWTDHGTVSTGSGWREVTPGSPVTARAFRWQRVEGGGVNAGPEEIEFVGASDSALTELDLVLRFAASAGNVAAGTAPTGTGAVAGYSTTVEGGTAATGVAQATSREGDNDGAIYNAITSSFNGTGIDQGAASSRGLVAHLHAVKAQGAGKSLVVKIQHSSDNGGSDAWADLVTFDTLTSAGTSGASRKTLLNGTTVKRYVRVIVADGAITGTWAFTVILSRQGPNI